MSLTKPLVAAMLVATTGALALDYDELADAYAKAKTPPKLETFGAHAVQVFPGSCFSDAAKATKEGALLFAYGKDGKPTHLEIQPVAKPPAGKTKAEKAAGLLTEYGAFFEGAPKRPHGGHFTAPVLAKDGESVAFEIRPGPGRSKELGLYTQVSLKAVTAAFADATKPVFLAETKGMPGHRVSGYCLFFAAPFLALGE